ESSGTGFVAGAEARCAYWSDGRGRAEFHDWLAPLPPVPEPAPAGSGRTGRLPPGARLPGAGSGVDALRSELTAQGRSVVVVDLSARLPQAVHGLGLRAVKVMVQGLQPLIMLDQQEWSEVAARLTPRRPAAGPHPL